MNLLAVFVGGLAGTALRLGLDAVIPYGDDGFPWSTLLINVTGSFLLGLLVGRLRPTAPSWLRLGLGTGLLGSFTTFSALAASVFLLTAREDELAIGLAYLAATLVAGAGAALLGLRLGGYRTAPVGADR